MWVCMQGPCHAFFIVLNIVRNGWLHLNLINIFSHQGCSVGERVGTAFPHLFALVTLLEMWDPNDYIKPWLRSHRCASNTQIRSAGQKSTVKQEDPVWKSLQANAHFIRIFLCIWCGNGVPTPLFLALHHCFTHIKEM